MMAVQNPGISAIYKPNPGISAISEVKPGYIRNLPFLYIYFGVSYVGVVVVVGVGANSDLEADGSCLEGHSHEGHSTSEGSKRGVGGRTVCADCMDSACT